MKGGIKMDKYNRNEIAKFYWNSRTIVDEFTGEVFLKLSNIQKV